MRRLLPLMLIALFAVPATAGAKVNVAVGIGDQSANMFSSPLYKALKMKKARYFIHWNAATNPTELRKAADFVTAAKANNVKVLMHISTNNLTPGRGTLPSVAQYKKSVGDLIKLFKGPGNVTEWGVWNEANHNTQPTSKNPKRAAEFYKAMKGMCSGCKIVALDVLDQAGVQKYIASWFKAAGSSGRTAKIFGIHNYSEVNRRLKERRSASNIRRYPGTKRIIDAVRKKNKVSKFWYTETGGLVNFGSSFPCDERRPSSRNKFMFDMAKRYDKQVERLYTYNWFGTNPDCQGFDAGLVNADGTARPGYAPFKSALKNFGR